MKKTLERLSKIKAPICVTIILETHKTFPDNKQDSILLKNLIRETSTRLQKEYGEEVAKNYTKKLEDLAANIDHNYNDLGLMLFVNDDVAEVLKIPVRPNTRVILDDTFATRSIVRALKRDTDYYLLALTKGKARLIHASSDDVVEEITRDGFPVEDKTLFSMTNEEAANANKVTNLTQEFFNRVDKMVNEARKNDPHSVVVYSEETNFHQYMKEADYPNTILGHVTLKNFDDKASNLTKEIWEDVKKIALEKENARISELNSAVGTGKYLSDMNEIWNAIQEGRGKTIFVEEGYFQPVKNEGGVFTPIEASEISSKDHVNDIIDDMIENNLNKGGDVVFLKPGSLEKFNKLALVTRY